MVAEQIVTNEDSIRKAVMQTIDDEDIVADFEPGDFDRHIVTEEEAERNRQEFCDALITRIKDASKGVWDGSN